MHLTYVPLCDAGRRDQMRLLDSLLNAEKTGTSAVRKRVERAREEWNDVERRIRQRMRIYPQKLLRKVTRPAPEAEESHELSLAATAGVSAGHQTLKPIISVHGRDLTDSDFDDD
jgi:hypothetical protein